MGLALMLWTFQGPESTIEWMSARCKVDSMGFVACKSREVPHSHPNGSLTYCLQLTLPVK